MNLEAIDLSQTSFYLLISKKVASCDWYSFWSLGDLAIELFHPSCVAFRFSMRFLRFATGSPTVTLLAWKGEKGHLHDKRSNLTDSFHPWAQASCSSHFVWPGCFGQLGHCECIPHRFWNKSLEAAAGLIHWRSNQKSHRCLHRAAGLRLWITWLLIDMGKFLWIWESQCNNAHNT